MFTYESVKIWWNLDICQVFVSLIPVVSLIVLIFGAVSEILFHSSLQHIDPYGIDIIILYPERA